MGRPVIDLTGKRFGMLTVDYLYPEDKYDKNGGHMQKQWYCTCDCGGHRIVTGNYLKLGHIKSCGCTERQECFTGRKIGMLTVGESFKKKKRTYYHCMCECGNCVDVDHYALRDKKRVDCGRHNKIKRPNRIVDMRGYTVGRLTVLDEEPIRHITSGGNTIIKWKCRCACGNIIEISTASLKQGKTKSCGCLGAERSNMTVEEYRDRVVNSPNRKWEAVDLTGQRFGKLVAIERIDDLNRSKGRVLWKCKCDCGNYTVVQTSNLTNGHTQSCGCINSVGESIIGRYLEKCNVQYKKFYRDQRCRDKRPLPFDFAILENDELKGLIEYDGKQHFEVVRFNGMTPERAKASFATGVIHDEIKNEFCRCNNIPLLRIKYDQMDNIELLVENFLNEVLDDRAA
jgi:hypothetical protein